MPGMYWTAERREQVLALRRQSLGPQAFAAELDLTARAVSALLYRLGASSRRSEEWPRPARRHTG